MSREQLRTPDKVVADEFARVTDLLERSIARSPDRNRLMHLMSEANEKGLNWIEGLEYAAERQGSPT